MTENNKLFRALQNITPEEKIKNNILNYYSENYSSEIIKISDKIIKESKKGKALIKYEVDNEDVAYGLAKYFKTTTGIDCYAEFNIIYFMLLGEG